MITLKHLVTAIALLLTSLVSAQTDLTDERILLTFVPNVQFAPFYVGIQHDIFSAAGFDVTLEHLQEPEVLDLIAVGQANYGIVSGEQVILARSRGRDVVYVFEWFQQYPVALVHGSDLDLSILSNLHGRRIGIPGRFGASYSGLTTLLNSAGLNESDIELDEIGFNAPEVFCLGAVDAAIVYANNEPLQIRNLAAAGECGVLEEIAVVMVASQVDLVSNGLIVNRDLLEAAPDQIASMVGALRDALRTTIDNPAAAYLASLPYVDTLARDDALLAALTEAAAQQRDLLSGRPTRAEVAASRQALAEQLSEQFDSARLTQLQVLLNSIELWDADVLGYSDLASWEAMRDTLALMNLLGTAVGDLDAAFSNEFLAVSGA